MCCKRCGYSNVTLFGDGRTNLAFQKPQADINLVCSVAEKRIVAQASQLVAVKVTVLGNSYGAVNLLHPAEWIDRGFRAITEH